MCVFSWIYFIVGLAAVVAREPVSNSRRSATCPDGFVEFCDTTCECYVFVPYGLSWEEAKTYCETKYNSDLTSVHHDSLNEFLWTLIPPTSIPDGIWLGATRNEKMNFTFKWVDDSCFDYGDFTPGNPDNINGNQDCIRMIGPADPQFKEPHKWDDYNCGALFASVCKSRQSSPITTTSPTSTLGPNYTTLTVPPSNSTTTSPGGTTVLPNCEPGWRPFCHSQGCHCYSFTEAKLSWAMAEKRCVETYSGHLASVHSAEENKFLYDWLVESGQSIAFIGLNKMQVYNVWAWSDGTEVDYQKWGPNEPNCSGTCYAAGLYYLYEGWNDQEETTPQTSFCKKMP